MTVSRDCRQSGGGPGGAGTMPEIDVFKTVSLCSRQGLVVFLVDIAGP